MADDLNGQEQTSDPAAEAAAKEAERKTREQAELAQAISKGVVEGLAARSAAERQQETPAAQVQEPQIEEVDPMQLARLMKDGDETAVANMLAKFGRGVEERARRAVMAETGGAVHGLHELTLSQARKEIEHFSDFEDEILKVASRVQDPSKRTLKVYQEATAMVLGRPENQKKIVDEEINKVLSRQKPSAGAAETGGATRLIKGTGSEARGDGDLAATEDNLEKLVGADAYAAFIDLKRSRGVTLDGFAQRLGYEDAKVWFKRMQDNDRRSATEGLGLDR